MLQWNRGADSCLCYTGVMDCCHSGPCPTSSPGLWLSDRLQVLENLPLDDPTPCSYPPPSSLLGAARSAVTPVYCPHPGPLTRPSVSPAGDGVGGTVRQGQECGLTLITLALLPAITFSFPSSVPPNPSVTSIKSRAIYSSPLGMFYYNT